MNLKFGKKQKIWLRLLSLLAFMSVGVSFQNCAPLKCASAIPSPATGTPINGSGASSNSNSTSTSSSSSVTSSADCAKSTATASASPSAGAAGTSSTGTRAPSSYPGFGGSSSGSSSNLPPANTGDPVGGSSSGSGNSGWGGPSSSSGGGFSGSSSGSSSGSGSLPGTSGLYMFTVDLKDAQISNGVVDSESSSRAYFSVSMQGGNTPYTYKWYKDNVALTAAQVSSSTDLSSSTISLDSTIANPLGEYYVEVTDASGKKITSKRANLTLQNLDCKEEYFFALENSSTLDAYKASYDITALIAKTKSFYKETNGPAYLVSQRNWFPAQNQAESLTGSWATSGLYRGSNKIPAGKYGETKDVTNCRAYLGKDHHIPVARPDRAGRASIPIWKCYGNGGSGGFNLMNSECEDVNSDSGTYNCTAAGIDVKDENSACFQDGVDSRGVSHTYTGYVRYQCKGNRWMKVEDTCSWK